MMLCEVRSEVLEQRRVEAHAVLEAEVEAHRRSMGRIAVRQVRCAIKHMVEGDMKCSVEAWRRAMRREVRTAK